MVHFLEIVIDKKAIGLEKKLSHGLKVGVNRAPCLPDNKE